MVPEGSNPQKGGEGAGPFSAQATDLHSVWSSLELVNKLRCLDHCEKSLSGVVQWPYNATMVPALQQFGDNLVVAIQGHGCPRCDAVSR